jgi:hypothetical protein
VHRDVARVVRIVEQQRVPEQIFLILLNDKAGLVIVVVMEQDVQEDLLHANVMGEEMANVYPQQ